MSSVKGRYCWEGSHVKYDVSVNSAVNEEFGGICVLCSLHGHFLKGATALENIGMSR